MKISVKVHIHHIRHGQFCETDDVVRSYPDQELATVPNIIMGILLGEEFNKSSDSIQVLLAEEVSQAPYAPGSKEAQVFHWLLNMREMIPTEQFIALERILATHEPLPYIRFQALETITDMLARAAKNEYSMVEFKPGHAALLREALGVTDSSNDPTRPKEK